MFGTMGFSMPDKVKTSIVVRPVPSGKGDEEYSGSCEQSLNHSPVVKTSRASKFFRNICY